MTAAAEISIFPPADRRGADRQVVDGRGRISGSAATTTPIRLLEVSITGFRCAGNLADFFVGDRIRARFGAFDRLGIVRWKAEDQIGCEFQPRLTAAETQSLLREVERSPDE